MVKQEVKSSKIFRQFKIGRRKTNHGSTCEKFLGLQENRPKPEGRASHHSMNSGSRFSFEKAIKAAKKEEKKRIPSADELKRDDKQFQKLADKLRRMLSVFFRRK